MTAYQVLLDTKENCQPDSPDSSKVFVVPDSLRALNLVVPAREEGNWVAAVVSRADKVHAARMAERLAEVKAEDWQLEEWCLLEQAR
jgi:hypothetical protein